MVQAIDDGTAGSKGEFGVDARQVVAGFALCVSVCTALTFIVLRAFPALEFLQGVAATLLIVTVSGLLSGVIIFDGRFAFLTGLSAGFVGSPVATAYVVYTDFLSIPFVTVLSALYAENLALFTVFGVVGGLSSLVGTRLRAYRVKSLDRQFAEPAESL